MRQMAGNLCEIYATRTTQSMSGLQRAGSQPGCCIQIDKNPIRRIRLESGSERKTRRTSTGRRMPEAKDETMASMLDDALFCRQSNSFVFRSTMRMTNYL